MAHGYGLHKAERTCRTIRVLHESRDPDTASPGAPKPAAVFVAAFAATVVILGLLMPLPGARHAGDYTAKELPLQIG